ncbi:MAG: LacI family transcriptional regulator [Spirochaetes bacterium]|nr:LacI family transcriptional regulator [Spirochaetota bacterium]
MATQEDVARLAGVSFITVSRVINSKDNVKEETKKRVLKAIKELNYYPNSLGRALNNNRVFTLGAVSPLFQGYSLESDLYFAKILSGIEKMCFEKGYDLLISTKRQSSKDFNYFRLFYQRKVDGIIFMGANLTSHHIEEIKNNHIPCCIISDNPNSSAIGYIDADNKNGTKEAVIRLLNLGHKKIAFLGITEKNQNIEERYKSFIATLKEHQIPFPKSYLILGDYSEQSGEQAIEYLCKLKNKPTALFCSTDSMAYGALKGAKKRRIKVPDQLSIIGFDGFEIGKYIDPDLATVKQPLNDMGYKAAQMLIERIEQPDQSKEKQLSFAKVIFPVIQVEGRSIGTYKGIDQ